MSKDNNEAKKEELKSDGLCDGKKELTDEELKQISGGDEPIGQNKESGLKGFRIHGIGWNG